VSPHLDDAVLSCGQLLAGHPGSHILTVFAAGPLSMSELTDWDRLSGVFKPGDDVIGTRRREDEAAATALGATSEHLSFWQESIRADCYGYLSTGDDELESRIASAIGERVAKLEVDLWLFPLGITHTDHKMVASACLTVARSLRGRTYLYEELPYRLEDRAAVAAARYRVGEAGFLLERGWPPGARGTRRAKRAALRCYRSQLPALGRRRVLRSLVGPERIWRLSPT
jgi:LmbE family N-acetylglucosaminyl deacetylase